MDLNDLMRRAQDSRDSLILIGFDDVRRWPMPLLDELLKHKVIRKSQPAQTLVCPGCEEACCRPVQTFPGLERAFLSVIYAVIPVECQSNWSSCSNGNCRLMLFISY